MQQEALPKVLTRQETAQRADLQRELQININVVSNGGTPVYNVPAAAFAAQKELSSHQTNVQQQQQMHGIVLIFFFGAPSILSCAPKFFSCAPKILAVRLEIYMW